MQNITSNINANPQFDIEDYNKYKSEILKETPKIWSVEQMDHVRLPGNIDITDLLIYIGKCFNEWLSFMKYTGEIPNYSASYPDSIYSMDELSKTSAAITNDSPHKKIPMLITYKVRYRSPATMSQQPFQGKSKQWNFRTAGEFKGEDGNVYVIKERFLDNLVEFTTLARSGEQADWLVQLFETFMDLNYGKLMEAGMNKMAFYARTSEKDDILDKSGYMHYRKSMYWIRTQEFKYSGPVGVITDIDIDMRALNAEVEEFSRKMKSEI